MEEFNEQAINEARDIMGDGFKTLVLTYLKNASSYMKYIKIGAVNEDAKQVMDFAHSLKSSSYYLGMQKLGSEAEELEALARGVHERAEGSTKVFTIRVQMLEELFKRAEAHLEALV